MSIILEMRGISKSFPGVKALRDVNLAVQRGEIHAICGENGAGKSTLMKVLSGVYPHGTYEGEIVYEGEERRFARIADSEHLGIIIIHQELALVPLLSIAENMTATIVEQLGPAGLVLPARRDTAAGRMQASLQIVASSTEQPIRELSGGNQQKAVMARALASSPKVLVLLYPTQGVDIASKEALFGIVERSRAAGMAVLVVSDELDELSICDRILVIFKGALTAEFAAGWDSEQLVAAIEGVGHGG